MRDRGEVLDIAKNRCPGANASGFGRRAPLVARGIAASGPHVPRLPAQRAVASCGSTPRHVTPCHAFRPVSFAGASHRFAGAGRFVERRLRAICVRRQAAPFRAPFLPAKRRPPRRSTPPAGSFAVAHAAPLARAAERRPCSSIRSSPGLGPWTPAAAATSGCASAPAEIVHLAERHALVPQDVVRGRRMEIEVRQRKAD